MSCPPLLPSTDGNGKCQTLLWIFSSLLRQQAHFGQTSPSLSTTTGMVDIFHKVDDASKRYDMEGNYVAGANIAGFEKVVDAMIAQGIV